MTAPAFMDNKSHKLILGNSFRPSGSTAFHTARYDFKPASVDSQREGLLEIGNGNEVTISLPNVQGSKSSCTVYKGSKRSVQKECVLIYDNSTGEFTLERTTSQIQVKRYRDSGNATFSSNPILHAPTAPRMPTHNSKKQSRSSKQLSKRNDASGKAKDYATSGSSSSFMQVAQPSFAPPSEQMSADEGNSSGGDNSSSDADSGSSSDDDDAAAAPSYTPAVAPSYPHPQSIFESSQLDDDLALSESGTDTD